MNTSRRHFFTHRVLGFSHALILAPFFWLSFFLISPNLLAQGDAQAAAQANNPLANMTALSFQNYYIGELTGIEESANQLWARYATPLSFAGGDWLFRASLPINTYPIGPNFSDETGTGDVNMLASYLFDTGNPSVSFGLGPQITLSTESEDGLGSGKYSAGFANVYFNAESTTFQYGYLLTWQQSFAGDDDREDVNLAAFQLFAMYQLGQGLYLRSVPIAIYNFENDNYSVPLGLGIGKVFKRGKTVFNMYIEPQVSVADEGAGQPDWQVLLGFNMQFMK